MTAVFRVVVAPTYFVGLTSLARWERPGVFSIRVRWFHEEGRDILIDVWDTSAPSSVPPSATGGQFCVLSGQYRKRGPNA